MDDGRQAALERQLGVTFRHPELLVQALTHRSYVNEVVSGEPVPGDNERLEFLGDAVLDYLVGTWVYHTLPDAAEGELTRTRSALVRSDALAGFARELDLGGALYLGRGEREAAGAVRASVLADAFEALVGALYLDQGMEAARRMVLPFLERSLGADARQVAAGDAKTRLQEMVQARFKRTPHYETMRATGPDHAKRFVVAVRLGDEILGTGEGSKKSAAAQAAASAAIQRLEAEGGEP